MPIICYSCRNFPFVSVPAATLPAASWSESTILANSLALQDLKHRESVQVISTYPARRAARSESSYQDTRADTDDALTGAAKYHVRAASRYLSTGEPLYRDLERRAAI